MKAPQRPPSQADLLREFGASDSLEEILRAIREPIVNGQYLHWDKLRHLEPPAGLDRRAWWLGMKLRRSSQARAVPLKDRLGAQFTYSLVDPLLEFLHQVDSQAQGAQKQPEPITTPETRNSYLVRSLIEESITSSQLEGAHTTREVAKKMIQEGRKPRDRGERMILNNFRAMQHILDVKDGELTPTLVHEIHRMVTDGTLSDPDSAGRFRRPDQRITVSDTRGEELHVPPPAEELPARMEQMCEFANGLTPGAFIHPVIRSMVLHFWLAYDHPFVDGNGRTARALFYWSMLKHGYRLFEFLSISRILLKGPAQYGRAFLHTETDDNDLTYFLIYHADVIRKAISGLYEYIARRTSDLVNSQRELPGLADLNQRQCDLIQHVLRHPREDYTVEYHRSQHDVVYETARSDLLDLVARGFLRKRKRGRRWVFTPEPDLEQRLKCAD
jgi:Fic family protein